MEVNINLDHFVGENESRVLTGVLGCQNEEELKEKLTGISIAAIYEYLEMLLGKQMPTRANEMRERRLYLLLKHYFQTRFPSEAEVSSMFQLTESDSRRLLRNVRTKFRFELENELLNTIRSTLQSATQHSGGDYRVVITSENILEELKQKVSVIAAELDQIQKVKNSAGVFVIPEDTFNCLCDAYGINEAEAQVATAGEQ